ncbi:MAG: hypothetical protein M0C28_47965 [Candidatus Moduliflexus flocculans]|nr:hypothetical protein [Candidatus Moduliflexus flocculans]
MTDQLFGVWYARMLGLEAGDAMALAPPADIGRAAPDDLRQERPRLRPGRHGRGQRPQGRRLPAPPPAGRRGLGRHGLRLRRPPASSKAWWTRACTRPTVSTTSSGARAARATSSRRPRPTSIPSETLWNDPDAKYGDKLFRAMKYMRPGAVWALYEALLKKPVLNGYLGLRSHEREETAPGLDPRGRGPRRRGRGRSSGSSSDRAGPRPRRSSRLWSRRGVAKPNVILVTLDTDPGRPPVLLRQRRSSRRPISTPWPPGARCSSRRPRRRPLTLPAHCTILTGMYPTFHGVRVNGNTALSEEQTTLAEVFAGAGLPLRRLHRGLRRRRPLGPQAGLRALRRPARPAAGASTSTSARSSGRATRSWTRPWPGSTGPRTRRSSPGSTSTIPTPPTSRPSPTAPNTRGAGPGRALRRRGRLHGRADRAPRRLARAHRPRPLDRPRPRRRPRRGSGQPRRERPRLLRLRLRRPRAPHRRRAARRARGASAWPPRSRRPTSSRPSSELAGLAGAGETQGRSLVRSMLKPGLRPRRPGLRRVDGPEHPVRLEPAPRPADGPLQAHRRAEGRALRPRPRPRRDDQPAGRGSRDRPGPEGRARRPWSSETEKGAPSPQAANLDKDTMERLSALGYVGTPVAARKASGEAGPPADPKDKFAVFQKVTAAGELVTEEKYAEAMPLLEAALAEEPGIPQALLVPGDLLQGDGPERRRPRSKLDLLLKSDPENVQGLISPGQHPPRRGPERRRGGPLQAGPERRREEHPGPRSSSGRSTWACSISARPCRTSSGRSTSSPRSTGPASTSPPVSSA